MLTSHYQEPSELGLPILKLFVQNPTGECRQTLYIMERHYGWGWNLKNAAKYLWRLGVKTKDIESDLNKAIQYLQWELEAPFKPLSFDTRNAIETAIEMCELMKSPQKIC
jgi:hypothetical protein